MKHFLLAAAMRTTAHDTQVMLMKMVYANMLQRLKRAPLRISARDETSV